MAGPSDSDSSRPTGILILRPEPAGKRLASVLQQQGFFCRLFPTIAVKAFSAPDDKTGIDQLADFSLLIFISANAVNFFIQRLSTSQLDALRRKPPQIAVIGRATASALQAAGLRPSLIPEGKSDSESLLAMPQLQPVAGNKILIVRGHGGRELLHETLTRRGAQVSYLDVYQRTLAASNCHTLEDDWPRLDVIVATSNEVLDNFVTLAGPCFADSLFDKTLLVISKRMQLHASSLGFRHLQLANGPDDALVAESLAEYQNRC